MATLGLSEAERESIERGWRYVHSGNEPLLIAGVATETLEIFEDHPEIAFLQSEVGEDPQVSGGPDLVQFVVVGNVLAEQLDRLAGQLPIR